MDLTARQVAEISPSPSLGAERVGVRWGIPAVPSSGATHLTLPSLPRRVPPSPPQAGGEGQDAHERSVPTEMCACPSAAPAFSSVVPAAILIHSGNQIERETNRCFFPFRTV